MEGGDLEFLMKNSFTKLPPKQQLQIIADGRPTPQLENLRSERGKGFRSFKEDNYVRTEWLAGSAKLQKLFCWPCMLFDRDECRLNNPWASCGFADLGNLSRALERHSKSKNHIDCSVKLKYFGRAGSDKTSDVSGGISRQTHNEQVRKNRDVLRRHVVAALYLARQEQVFGGHNERSGTTNRGNFVEFVHSFAELDSTLADHLQTSAMFTGLCSTIQNDIVESIAAVIHKQTEMEIKTSPFIAVQVDDISSISNKRQLAAIVRYVDGKGSVCEHFLGFYDVSSPRDAKAVAAVAMQAIKMYNPKVKLVCQTYDGGCCMSGGQGGVQAVVKSQCPNALFIHCYAHELNHVLAQGTKVIQAARLFFADVDSFRCFFSQSRKRSAFLYEVDHSARGTIPGGPAMRWNFKSRPIYAIHEGRVSLMAAFDRIMVEPGWDKETIALSMALKHRLEDFDFCFLIGVFQTIFSVTEPLLQVLQSMWTVDIKRCQECVKDKLGVIASLRTDESFSGLYDKAVQLVGEPAPPRRKRRRRNCDDMEQGLNQHQDAELKTLTSFRQLYYQILDSIAEHMTQRFADMERISFFRLLEHTLFEYFCKPIAFPIKELAQLIKTYPYFEEPRLRKELRALYTNTIFHKSPPDLLRLLIEDGLKNSFPEVTKLLKLVLTIPATSTTAERSFSCLERTEMYLRNTCGEDRLVNLAQISINSAVVDELKASEHFYDAVIDHFANVKGRQMEFNFK
ncbi:zinc finger MYM-type protein 1-like [Engraulis encrasicolus]|uniref:zinc finger MYM-type protein 1-like n=1 Tax=Engraulis encrasicolus TaxID=184585 RepID=UPI002FD09517